jgi:hypothetical protein
MKDALMYYYKFKSCIGINTGMRRITTFRSTKDRIYDGVYDYDIIILYYNITIQLHSVPYTNYQGLDIICSHISEQSTTTYFKIVLIIITLATINNMLPEDGC